MEKKKVNKTKNSYRNIARYSILVIASILFVFSLLSGSESYNGTLKGVLSNSMNTLPWLILFILLFVAWKRELLGGVLIVLFGLWAICFFNFQGANFWWSIFFITLIIPILGSFFILSWYKKHNA